MPHAKPIPKPEDAEAYLTEARMVADLDHPGIVPVHDVGSTEDCPCYVVVVAKRPKTANVGATATQSQAFWLCSLVGDSSTNSCC